MSRKIAGRYYPACIIMMLLFVLLVPPVLAAKPDCSDPAENHPKCSDDSGDGPVFKATLAGFVDAMAWTQPGKLNGDEKGLHFSPNGLNVIEFSVDNSFMAGDFPGNEDLCFPSDPGEFSGSLHLVDYFDSRNESDRVGYIWLGAKTISGEDVQYAIDLFDDGSPWAGGVFPPEIVGEEHAVYRSVTRWETRLTKGKYKDGCESGGLISETAPIIDIQLERVESNPFYN